MKRSKFSLSHYKLLTCDMGELIPCALMEVLPGDTFQQASSCLVRVSPMLAPVMHPVHVRLHHWFVPHRLVWTDFESFITGGPDGMDATVHPTVSTGGAVGSLADYLGIAAPGNTAVSALPFRGYQLIWNEWYRDQDLQTEAVISTGNGADSTTNVLVQNVDWEKDYFTSARPWPQKGPEVTLPLGIDAPVVTTGGPIKLNIDGTARDLTVSTPSTNLLHSGALAGSLQTVELGSAADTGLKTDLTGATAASINDLREAFALQRFAEARARYGSRYTEYLRYLGIRSSDARLQRPEYLGGGRQVIQMSEVLQTGVTTSGTPNTGVASLKGHGIGAMRSNRYRRFFEEHGYIFSLLSVKPRTMYVQGIPRTFNRVVKEDYYQKELQHIGQQEILNKELYAAHATPNGTFGYQDRYDEYRRMESGVAGQFRQTSLDFWHMARIFASTPALNGAFVSSVPTKRIHIDQTAGSDVLWIMVNHSVQARRMLTKTGTSFTF